MLNGVERHSRGSLWSVEFEAKLSVDSGSRADKKLIRSVIGFYRLFNYSGKGQLDLSFETPLWNDIKKRLNKKLFPDYTTGS